MKKVVAAVALGALLVAGSGWAVPIKTLDVDTLAMFTLQGATGASPAFSGLTSSSANEADFTVLWVPPAAGPVTATLGLSGLGGLDWSSYDYFALQVANRNENPWSYSLSLADVNGNTATSGVFSIVNGTSETLFVNLDSLSFDSSKVNDVFFTVGAVVPIAGYDRTAEFALSPVPEPQTLLLLGAGLLGVAGRFNRKKKI